MAQDTVAFMAATEPTLSATDLKGITCPTLLMFADDGIITMQQVMAMYNGTPDAQLAILPGTSHFLLRESRRCATPSLSTS